jgi:hypothetical protein
LDRKTFSAILKKMNCTTIFPWGKGSKVLMAMLLLISSSQPSHSQTLPAETLKDLPGRTWLKDAAGCQINLEDRYVRQFSDFQTRWTGQCVNGKAEGDGELILSAADAIVSKLPFLLSQGLMLKGGVTTGHIPTIQAASSFDRSNCFENTGSGEGGLSTKVRVNVDRDLALWNVDVALQLFGEAAEAAINACPPWRDRTRPRSANVQVFVYVANQLVVSSGNLRAPITCTPKCIPGDWLTSYDAATNSAREKFFTDLTISKHAAAKAAVTITKARLTSQYNIDGWVTQADLASNPFRFKGQVVAIPAEFVKMLSEHNALFRLPTLFGDQWLSVSKPPVRELKGPEYLLLIIRVAGMTALSNGRGGSINVPQAEYVGSYRCRMPAESSCPYGDHN